MMRDCSNVNVRERLPDLLHDRLSAAERADVHAHLNACADCRAELHVLERVRDASFAPRVDSTRIVAALPPYRAVPWRKALASPMLRIAAAILVVAGAATLLSTRDFGGSPKNVLPVASLPPVVDTLDAVPDTSREAPQRRGRAPEAPTELAVGETFHDLTDAELKSLLDAFGALEALTPIEPEVVVPAVGRGGA